MLVPAALLAAASAAGCRADESPWSEERLAAMTLRERVAQMVAPALPSSPGGGPAADSAVAAALAAEGVGGIVLVPERLAVASPRVEALQRLSSIPVLVVAEMDRGPGAILDGGTEVPPPAALAGLDRGRAAALARAVAAEAASLGIGLALLAGPSFPSPASLPAPGGGEPEEAVARFVAELSRAGVLVGVRAFASDAAPVEEGVPVLAWDGAAIRALQLDPLRGWLERGAAAVLPAQVALPALTRDSVPLPASPVAVRGTLRRDLGFEGLVLAEAGPESVIARAHGEAEAAVLAAAAGADLVLGVRDPRAAIDALVAAVEGGRISPSAVEASVRRIFAAKEAAGLGRRRGGGARGTSAPLPAPATGEAHRAAVTVLGQAPSAVLRGCRQVVLATRPGAGAAALSTALAEAVPGIVHLETDRLPLRGPLLPPDVPFAQAGADCAVGASFPHAVLEAVDRVSPPDTTAPGDSLPRRIVWVEFLPAPHGAPPAARSLVVARGTGAAAQHAAAAALTDGDAPPPLPEGTVWPPARTLRVLPPDSAGMRGDSLASIDRFVGQALAAGVFDAAAVVVARRGVVVKLTGYGRVPQGPVDPAATLFDIASLTKVVGTTSAAMVAVDDGRMELDQPVRRYLRDFREGDRGRVTVRHLLAHTSGLPAGAWLFGSAAGPEQALRQVKRARLTAAPGERAVYSDFGMILLAAALEEAEEEPLDRLLARRVFGPLGMSSTMYLPPVEEQPRTVATAAPAERPYVLDAVVHDGNAFRLGGVTGHAGIFSTGWDLAVYAQTVLNGGAYGTRRVFLPQTVAAFTRPQQNAETRALGWDTPQPVTSAGSYFSARSFGHTGYTGTSLWIDPERELFVILLTNRTFTRGSTSDILNLRARVADMAALSIADPPLAPRPGSVAARRAATRRR